MRRVTLIAPADGIVRSQDARAGVDVRVNQEVAKLDTAEAFALLRIAQAEAKEQEAAVELARAAASQAAGNRPLVAQAEARLDAAKARVELAQAALDRCALRAPFPGRILRSHVSDGQFVNKGTVIADLADLTSLRVLVPLTRGSVQLGGETAVVVEGQTVNGKVQAFLPLPEEFSALRELATPLTAAWVVLPNDKALEPGQRVFSPAVPTAPVASVPSRSVQLDPGQSGTGIVQVLRNEYVTNVPVRVLGSPVPDRLQVSGVLRPTDALIVATSVPLLPGTFVRFNGAPGAGQMEGTTPNPTLSGDAARVEQPRGRPGVGGPAPIGAPGSAAPRRPGAPAVPVRPGGGSVPF